MSVTNTTDSLKWSQLRFNVQALKPGQGRQAGLGREPSWHDELEEELAPAEFYDEKLACHRGSGSPVKAAEGNL